MKNLDFVRSAFIIVVGVLLVAFSTWYLMERTEILSGPQALVERLVAQVSGLGSCELKNPTVSITPRRQEGAPGERLKFSFTVRNNNLNCDPATFDIRPWLDPRYGLSAEPRLHVETLADGTSVTRDFIMISPATAEAREIVFNQKAVNVSSARHWGSADARYVVMVEEVETCVRRHPSISVRPATKAGLPGQIVNYLFTVTNNNSSVCGESDFQIKPYFFTDSVLSSASTPIMTMKIAAGGQVSKTYSVKSSATASLGDSVRFNLGAYSSFEGVNYRHSQDLFYVVGTSTVPVSAPPVPVEPVEPVPLPEPPLTEGEPISLALITIAADSLVNNVYRLGVNIGYTASADTSVHFRKNIVRNPGFEVSTLRSNYVLHHFRTKDGNGKLIGEGSIQANQAQEFCWNTDWSNNGNLGQPIGTWNDADYEIMSGPLKGIKGVVQDFTYEADASGAPHYTFTLDKNLPRRPGNTDTILTVRKTFDDFDSTEKRPGSPGQRSLRLEPETGPGKTTLLNQLYDDGSSTVVEDGYSGKKMIVEGRWRLSFWAKAATPGDKVFISFVRPGTPGFLSEVVTLDKAGWQEYDIPFTVPVGTDARHTNAAPPVGLKISSVPDQYDRVYKDYRNRSQIWIDDVYLGEADNTNPTVFSDQAVAMLKELNPGVLRYWGGNLGEPLVNVLGSEWGRGMSRFATRAKTGNEYFSSLPEVLDLAKEIDADPWYVVPPTLTKEELKDLTTYVNSRAGEFNRIYLEYGNEMWGTGCGSDPFMGATVGFHLPKMADEAFEVMRDAGLSSKVKLIIGGQAAWVGRQSQIEANSDSHDITAIAPYYTMIEEGITNRPTPTVANLLDYIYASPLIRNKANNKTNQSSKIISQAGREPAIYEINFHDTGSFPPIALKNKILTGQAGGITLPLHMLHAMKESGIRIQTAFSFLQIYFRDTGGTMTRLWGIARDLDNIQAYRGTGLALSVANKAVFGDLIGSNVVGGGSWSRTMVDEFDRSKKADHVIPYLQSFAFKDGNRYGLIVFNVHQTATIKSKLDLPGVGGAGTRYQLYHPDPLATNERSVNLTIQEVPVTIDEITEYEFPPHSITSFTWSE